MYICILYSYIVYLLVYNAAESQDANLGPKLERIDGSVICPSLNSIVRNISGIGQMIKWIFGTILVGDGCLSPCFFVFMFSRYTALKDLARSCRAGQFFELAKQPQAQLLDRVIGAHPTISHVKGCNPIIPVSTCRLALFSF